MTIYDLAEIYVLSHKDRKAFRKNVEMEKTVGDIPKEKAENYFKRLKIERDEKIQSIDK